MRYSTFIAAVLAAGVSADDWQSWTDSSKSVDHGNACPAKITKTITQTAACAEVTSEIWQTTVTITPPRTRTVTVYADGKMAKNFWEDWTFEPAPTPVVPATLPAGCVPSVTTEIDMVWIQKPGSTTTVTKSTLFIGVGECSPTTITVTAAGSAPVATWAAGSWAPGSGSGAPGVGGGDKGGQYVGGGGGSDNGAEWNDLPAPKGPDYQIVDGGYKIPVSEKVVGTDLWKWDLPPPGNTKTYTPPVYTQKPDGSYGYNWGNWNGPGGSSGSGMPGGPAGSGVHGTIPNPSVSSPGASNSGTGNPGTGTSVSPILGGPGYNATRPSQNVTAGAPGSPGSNVTAPFLPIPDRSGCNTAASRGSWCNGRSIDSTIYDNYFSGGTCTYDLTLTRQTVDVDGTPREMLAVNGQIPGPLIECNWGDMITVTVHNQLGNNGTSMHWHGFRQLGTNNMDGVPGVTECPIPPGGSRTYSFHASSYGTTWYHSHYISQYGDGIYGPIIIHGPATANYDQDMGVVAIQDTFNVTAAQQNYLIAHYGPKNTVNYLLNGHNTKYDLSGGQHSLWIVEQGKKYLFRFVNAAAQNMYSVSLDNHNMMIIAADFVPIVPYQTKWLNIGIGQRYDAVITMDQPVSSYFLRAVTQTQCPSGCDNTGLGAANGIVAYQGVNTNPYYLPTSTTDRQLSDFATCDDEPLASLVPHVPLGAGSASAFAASASKLPAAVPASVQTTDDGVVFKWFLNNGATYINFTQPTLKSLAEHAGMNSSLIANPIFLTGQKQWVYFVIQNQFFAAHPMHLHGHDFSILGQGSGNFDIATMAGSLNFANPMRRDTAMLKGAKVGPPAPTGYTVIAFETDNPGAWLMHCHIIWHVDGGLGLQWIERPDEIPTSKFVGSDFRNTCAAYGNWEFNNPGFRRKSGSSGLKKRTFFDEQVARSHGHQPDSVVRRSDSAAKHYLDNKNLQRALGDVGGHRVHHRHHLHR